MLFALIIFIDLLPIYFLPRPVHEFLFRQGGGFLDDDRKTLIKKNRQRLQEQIDIQGEMLLDLLLERGVITIRNKQVIEVGLAYIQKLHLQS